VKVTEKEVAQAFSGESAKSEQIINTLLRSIGRKVGLGAADVDWDRRITVGDSGRDLIVHSDHTDESENFLPRKRSYWSVKSGKDGLDKSTFRSEINDHNAIQDWLFKGNTYVWCCLHDSTSDQRQEIKDDVATLVDKFNGAFDASQFEFRWIDTITEAINLNPGVIIRNMPEFSSRFMNLATVGEWARTDDARTQWVNFGDREGIIDRIWKHLNANDKTNLLHITGISGIGKSRLVREACSRYQAKYNVDVLYCEDYETLKANRLELLRRFNDDQLNAIIVIDEVGLEDLARLESEFELIHDRVRVVTIGPSKRQSYTGNRGNILLLAEPQTSHDVIAVITQNAAGLPKNIVNSVAERSSHDLRLALLLLRAVKDDPDGPQEIVGGVMQLFDRIVKRMRLNDAEKGHLELLYRAACCFIDFGISGEYKNELDHIKSRWGLEDVWLGRSMKVAKDFGLAAGSKNFFEATPHALASMMFSEHTWPSIALNLEEFLNMLPDRLKKRFLERCDDCDVAIREEVRSLVGRYFRGVLNKNDLKVLDSGDKAKVFSAWAMFDPAGGLDWLARAVESASIEDLVEFKGDSYRGDYAGRRHIVSLCDSLSRFPEYFFTCERILFRLATAESEPSIGNNATGIWKSLFWPVLSQSALPFDERSQVLLGRLLRETGEKGILCIDAAFDVLQSRSTGLPVPPRVVGGILAPAPWRVTSTEQLKELRQGFAEMFLKACTSLDGKELKHFQATLPKNLLPFVFLDLTDALRSVYGAPLNVSIAVAMTESIRRVIHIVEHERYKHQGVPWTKSLRLWEADLKPGQLKDRLAFLLQQSPWELEDSTDANDPYATMAEELSADTSSLEELSVVLSNDENQGAFNLGNACGKRENHLRFDSQVKTWLRDGKCDSYVAGYIFARLASSDTVTEDWQDELDQIVQTQPLYCATITTMIDLSERGFKRLMNLVDIGCVSDVQVYSRLGVGGWLHVLSDDMQTDVCNRLAKVNESAKGQGASIAVDLIFMWTHLNDEQVPSHLKEFCFSFLQLAMTSTEFKETYKWSELASKLVDEYPVRIAKLILDMYQPSSLTIRFDMERLDPIIVKAATLKPMEVMDSLGDVLLNEETRMIFEIVRHEGIFETIGQQIIEDWIAKNGCDYLGNIASHLASPFVDQHGQVDMPKVLEWLFTRYEDDDEMFEGFLSGRHRLNVSVGNVEVTEFEHTMKPFMEHPLRRVRDWAVWEIQQAKREKEWYEDYEEKRKRR
jgi:hypothetical protein